MISCFWMEMRYLWVGPENVSQKCVCRSRKTTTTQNMSVCFRFSFGFTIPSISRRSPWDWFSVSHSCESSMFFWKRSEWRLIYAAVFKLTLPVCCVSVIAVIAATLFPLWPAEMRVGVYYLSVAAGCFVASILLLAVGEYHVCVVENLLQLNWKPKQENVSLLKLNSLGNSSPPPVQE